MNVKYDFRAPMPPSLSFALRFLVLFVLIALVQNPAWALKVPSYTPGTLAACDGTGFPGLPFGKATAKSTRDSINVNNHNDIPRSLRLVTPRSSGLIIHALFAGKTDLGPLTGVLLEYAPGRPYLSAVQQDIGSEGVSYYPQTRYEDWWIQVFAKQCLVAYVTNAGVPQVQAIFACPPGAIDNSLDGYSTDKSPISMTASPAAQTSSPVQFGTVTVTADTTGMDIVGDTRASMESDMKSDTAGGTIRYWTGADGSYTVHLTGSYSALTGGTINADAVFSAPSPTGTVSGEATGSSDIPANTSDFGRYARAAASDARKAALGRFNDNLRDSNPPTLETYRERAWGDLITKLRFESDSVVLSTKSP